MAWGAFLLRAAGWAVCIISITISGLTALLALMIVGYEHSGSSPWPSQWAAVGSVLLAMLGPVAAGFGIHQLRKRRFAWAFALAAGGLMVPVGWYFTLVAVWS